MLAMFSSVWAWSLWRLDSLVSLHLTAALLFLLGIATYHGLIRWVLGAPMLARIFPTFRLAIFLRAAAQALWSVDFHLVNRDPGITVIFVEPNVELAGTLGHRGYVLDSGRHVLEGPSATLLQSSEVRRIFLGT